MTRKVILAIFDNDLKATVKKYEISTDGTKIRVKSKGGEGQWMPTFDRDSFIEFPFRSPFSFWKISYRRIYFVKKRGKKCVNFKTGEVQGPSPEDLNNAVGATLLKELGQEDKKPTWISYVTLALAILIFLMVSGAVR